MRPGTLPAPRAARGSLLVLAYFVGLPALAAPASATPAEPPAPAPAVAPDAPLTWAEVAGRVAADPRLVGAAWRVRAATAGVAAAGAAPNPSLEATVGGGHAAAGPDRRVEWGLALTVPFGWLPDRGARIRAAAAEVDFAAAEGRALRREVVEQLRAAFFALAYEQARLAAAEALVAEAARLRAAVWKRVEKGDVRPVEGLRAELEYEKVVGEREAAEAARAARAADLALRLGLPAGAALQVAAPLAELPDRAPAAAPRPAGTAVDPLAARAAARTRALTAARDAARLARVPNVALTAFTDFELDRRAYGFGIAVDLPLWNFQRGPIAAAEAELAASEADAAAEARAVEAALIEARATCTAAVSAATRARDALTPRAEAAAGALEKAYRLGEANLSDWIDARRTLLETRLQALAAGAAAHRECGRLAALRGEETP